MARSGPDGTEDFVLALSPQCGRLSSLGVVALSRRGCIRCWRHLAIEPTRPASQNGTMIVLTSKSSSNELNTAIHPRGIGADFVVGPDAVAMTGILVLSILPSVLQAL